MRPSTILAAAALASCSAPDAAGPAKSPAEAIPAAFRGMWDKDEVACGSPAGEYRLEVAADALRFHESIATVRNVAIGDARRISVEADWQGEGESWRNRRELSLSPDGRVLTVTGEGTSLVRMRCP
jgi:hypothetical protein